MRTLYFPLIKSILAFFGTVYDLVNFKSSLSSSKTTFLGVVFALSILSPVTTIAQTQSNEAEWNGYGYSIKKVVSNTSIPSGVNFSYTILFTAPAGATTVTIQDVIPSSLVVVNVPTPSIVNGVTPVVNISGSPGSQVVTYTLTSLPAGSPSSGSFTIVVKFPEGTTCNGAAARNRVGIEINKEWFYTPYVSTTATAVDPWVISKSILSGPVVNPNGGNCGYLMSENTTVTYRLSIMKNSPYWGNVSGQMNMSSAVVTDVLPTGAVFMVTPPPGVTFSGNTITWTPNAGLLDAAYSWAYYYVDITVTYPAGFFPNGSFVYNQATLTGNICQQQVTHQSNQTCIEVDDVTPNPNAYFQKYVNVTNRVPGCQGFYTIIFCNNGNVPLTAFTINDVIPSGITVEKVQLYGAGANTPVSITANSGANTLVTNNTSNWYDSGTIGFTVSNLQFAMNGSLPVGSCLYMYIYFNIDANPAGTQITNCATFNGLQNNLTLPQTCTTFTVAAAQPDPCLLKDICSPQTDYEPGDIIRFRLRVQNIGSADISGATIQDVLNPNFQYLGNESYYVSTSYNPPCGGGGIPPGATAWSGVTTSHSGNNLSWNLPNIPSDCQSFYVSYCGYYGTWGLPYYYIEFDVAVDSSAMPGVTPNSYDIIGGNLVAPETSNVVNVLVVASFGQETEKQVSTDAGASYASSGTVTPGSTARYRLKYKNTSNVPVSNVNLVDLLAMDDGPSNDWLVLNRAVSRGSQFDITYGASVSTSVLPSGTPPVPTVNFAAGENICLPPFGISLGCTGTSWALSPVTENVRFNYGTYSLLSGKSVLQDFDINIPTSATVQQSVCNDFAAIATANFLLNGNPQSVALTPIAAPPVCLSVVNGSTASCCDSVRVQQHFDPTHAGCCVELTSKCEIKLITVSLQNGTFTSASTNCGTLPQGYIGQSSLSLAPGNCSPVDLVTCVDAQQQGVVIINYTIYFANGETCEKTFDLDCGTPEPDCCDSVKVSQHFSDDGTAGCCVGFQSECEIKLLKVSLQNGTFSSATTNCGSLPAGYVGQSSLSYAPGNCSPVDLVICADPVQSGVVTAVYNIYFANGDTCTKTFKLECNVPEMNCCDSIKVSQLYNADGTTLCCVKLESLCEVDTVKVNVFNGTLSSVAWNCGNIPSGYEGMSSYSFAAGGCTPVMKVCVDAIQSGWVSVQFTVVLSNGEVCEKTIRIQCEAPEIDCCDSISVGQVSGANGVIGCCTQLSSLCDVEKVTVSVTNGILSLASWNCNTAIDTAFIGQSNFTFVAGGCQLTMNICYEALQAGSVTVNYIITLTNGEVCEKSITIECNGPEPDCCESLKAESYSSNSDLACCARIVSSCKVDSVDVSVVNGTLASATWNCGALPSGYVGQGSYTFVSNGCPLDLTTCVDAFASGGVVNYVVYFSNGEVCKKQVKLTCNVSDPCCALVDFKLKQKWPFSQQSGIFTITNSDPSSPICKVQINATPSGTFTPGTLVVDGVTSSQPWNSSSIPATGTLTSPAVNTISFNMTGNYKGVITICVEKCDGTRCCFDFKWNKNPIFDVNISVGQLDITHDLVAVSVNPVVSDPINAGVKYISFGLRDPKEVENGVAEFFAISATALAGDDYPEALNPPQTAYMGKYNAFFELQQPVSSGAGLGAFNLVFAGELPKLGCTLYDEEGNIIFSGDFDVSAGDTIPVSYVSPSSGSATLFEFISVYPNPSEDGVFTLKYATGNQRNIDVSIVNVLGQTLQKKSLRNDYAGIHKISIDTGGYPPGLYRMVISADGKTLSKSAVKK